MTCVVQDQWTDIKLSALDAAFEAEPAEVVLRWAVETFGDHLCLTASMTDAVLIDLATRLEPSVEVVFLDTQFHFPETLATLARVRDRYGPNLRVLRPDRPVDELWRTDPDACCQARKVEPLRRALEGKEAWMSGLRRADGKERWDTPIVTRDRRGLIKVNPLATWDDADVARYIADHDVPVNPLVAAGYPSIGCWPCTRRVDDGADRRSGRWSGSEKTECGLHL